jgi:hypothetical protein
MLCRIVVPLPPGKNPFAVQINNNNEHIKIIFGIEKGNIKIWQSEIKY